MGNTLIKKEFDKKSSTKSNVGPVLSNVPGVAPPPKFTSKIDRKRNNKNEPLNGNELVGSTVRQTQIDTLPRFTGGSSELIKSIELNRKNANFNDDSDIDSLILLHERFKAKSKVITNENDENLHLVALNTNQEQNTKNKNNTNGANKNANKNDVKYDSSNSQVDSLDNLRSLENKISRERTRIENELENGTTRARNYERLTKTREKIYSNLVSLNEIENQQKSKILEQERQLQIQNMKLKDALIIHRSLTNFNHYVDDYENLEDGSTLYKKQNNKFKSNTFIRRQPVRRQRIPLSSIKFPTIVSKFDAIENNEPRLDYIYSRHADHKLNEEKVGLYLENKQDIVDSNGRILSSNQTIKYLGEAGPQTASFIELNTNNGIFQNEINSINLKIPEIQVNNHKYEIIKHTQSTLTSKELEEIVKIIEETEKHEPKSDKTFFVNGNLIKRTNVCADANIEEPKIMLINDDLKPSFTISEKIYKMYLNRKQENKQFENNRNFNTISRAAEFFENQVDDDISETKKYSDKNIPTKLNGKTVEDHLEKFKLSKNMALKTKF